MPKTTTDLIDQLRKVGKLLDTTTDPAVLRFCITARKAITAELTARHTAGALVERPTPACPAS